MVSTALVDATPLAGPFLKWAGGKTQLLSRITPRLPDRIKTYYEPFIGGGAVFFTLANERRFRNAVLGDANGELVEVYRVVRDEVEDLIDALRAHAGYATDADYFYEVRGWSLDERSPVERAARLIFLNKTCFNGLYRVNKRGRFNVPFGRYRNPRVLNEAGLRAASLALDGVDLVEGDFATTTEAAKRGDAVYFDPPYVPVSDSASFTSYHRSSFGPAEQERLLEVYLGCCRRGAVALMSNSDVPYTRALYQDLIVQTVRASRAINSVASRRGQINEVLVVGRKVDRRRLATPTDSAVAAARTRTALRRSA